MAKELWIFPYKPKSKSALVLANELDVWCIKHEGSKFSGKPNQVVLNWGAGTGVYSAKTGKALLLNPPAAIDRCINKLSFFYDMEKGKDGPNIPKFTERYERALGWLDAGKTVIARTLVEGMKGEGLVVVKPDDVLPRAPLYTMRIPSTTEYRIYMFDDIPIDAREKILAKGAKPDPDHMRNDDRGYEFTKIKGGIQGVPAAALLQAQKAMRKTGLFTGGLDVLYDQFTDTATVLEMNTAPYIGGGTAELYAEHFKKWLIAA